MPSIVQEHTHLRNKLLLNKIMPSVSSNYIIKSSCEVVSPILMKLFNQCMEEGIFPDMLKIACIIPLYKSGDKNEPTNYRPISLLSSFSKLLEEIVLGHRVSFLGFSSLPLVI